MGIGSGDALVGGRTGLQFSNVLGLGYFGPEGRLKISPFPHGQSMIHGYFVKEMPFTGVLWMGNMVSQKCCFSNKL